jgi:predicted negative regulator of RcsB-dependent stress response
MADLTTDEEKLEAFKKWWKANGFSVVAGVVIGLGAVLGWRGWVNYQEGVAQRASMAFEQLLASTASDQTDSAEKQAEALIDDYGGTPYAMLAELATARVRVEGGDLDGAAEALRSAIAEAPDPGLAKLAALRLARVLIDDGDTAAAAQVIASHADDGAFAADFSALRGDIATAEGRVEEARTAYREAIDGGAGNAQLLELKLRELPAQGAS